MYARLVEGLRPWFLRMLSRFWPWFCMQFSICTSVMLAIMTFNSQLVLYHETDKFVVAMTDGPLGTF
jgi:hypothetical protein